jgi:RNA polymerase sigma-70 factor (ECF subfamily)
MIRAARSGDPKALRLLLALVSRPAFRFGMNFCRDREDAEEIAQDVLASLVRSLEHYRGEASLSTWAYTVARNACIRRRRRRSAPTESLEAWLEGRGEEPIDGRADPGLRLERRETRAAVEKALRGLPAPLREAALLRDVEGLSAGAAARVLGIGERALKSRLHRARLRLRTLLLPLVASEPSSPRRARGCPDIARYVSLHAEGDVNPTLCARLEAHVRACPACSATCRSMRSTLRACRLLRTKPLPAGARSAVRAAAKGARNKSATTG